MVNAKSWILTYINEPCWLMVFLCWIMATTERHRNQGASLWGGGQTTDTVWWLQTRVATRYCSSEWSECDGKDGAWSKKQMAWSEGRGEREKIAFRRQSVFATWGGKGTPELTPLDTKNAPVLWETSVCGIVSEREGDTDSAETTDKPRKYCSIFH